MITIVNLWEPGYFDEETHMQWRIWKQVIAAYGVPPGNWLAAPELLPGLGKPIQYNTLGEALLNSKGTRVYLDPAGSVDLKSFVHPEDAIYIFGHSMSSFRDKENTVRIETPESADLFGCSACSVVLQDRFNKL
jgi:hypothetical protein